MWFRADQGLFISAFLLMVGCSSHLAAKPAPNAPTTLPNAPTPAATAAIASSPSGAAPAPDSVATESPPPPPAADPRTGELPQRLPELKLKLVGMHIGGGPNDAESKRPFIASIERGFDAMRSCYGHVGDPEKGGTFGVDLRVDRVGGHPQLQAVRTAMKGDEFKSCVERVFRELEFARPVKGPTVLSASVRFSLET